MNFSNAFADFSTSFEHTHYFCFDYSAFSVFPLFEFANDASKLLPISTICAVKKLFLHYLPGGCTYSGLRVIAKIVQ